MSYYHYRGDRQAALLARELERHADHRVLRRLPDPAEMWLAPTPRGGATTTLAVLDTETTGLNTAKDAMIELAVVMMQLDADGQLIDITPPVSMLEQPPTTISADVEALTGIDDRMVAGRRFDDGALAALLREADVAVSHHAAFDRAFLVRRFAWFDLPWACTVEDIDWRSFGLEGRALGHLLASAGHFFRHGHRADEDAWALSCLLAREAADGRAVAAHLIDTARRPTVRLLACQAPFETRAALKAAGYRWNPERRAWWIAGDEERIAGESVFLRSLHPAIRPVMEPIDWFTRHAG